jgi:hypothetical protein
MESEENKYLFLLHCTLWKTGQYFSHVKKESQDLIWTDKHEKSDGLGRGYRMWALGALFLVVPDSKAGSQDDSFSKWDTISTLASS